jgi:hypothetical protein
VKERFLIALVAIVVVGLLAVLNAASYQQKEKTPDSELRANRSSFNSGSTGTQAWYTLLAETGRKVTRWQDAPASLLTTKTPPSVFVMFGFPRREVTTQDAKTILEWVERGGRLVLVDREPATEFKEFPRDWKISLRMAPNRDLFSIDPANQQQMTKGTVAVRPSQPGVLTQDINAIQPSEFVQNIGIEAANDGTGELDTTVDTGAPIVHFATGDRNIVVEVPHGSGSVVFVSDPYMVSNGGIALADNARLATNLVASGGTVAFDEYHQGYSRDSNRFLEFFEGTPVVAVFLQAVVLVGFIFYSQSRRFARPVPEPEADRLSKLEYVTAMAELQQRTRAWDLAIENIYADFRRRAARLFGIDATGATSDVLAKRIAERTNSNAAEIRETLFKCEEIIRGEPTDRSEVVRLVESLRKIEMQIGLRRARSSR